MAEIGGISGGGPIRRPGARGSDRPGFRLEGSGAARAAEATLALPRVSLGLLAAQEAAAGAERDARARRRAEALLEELRGLQRDMLRGRAAPARLRQLADLGRGEAAADPGLQEAIEAIALRARIELARHGLEE